MLVGAFQNRLNPFKIKSLPDLIRLTDACDWLDNSPTRRLSAQLARPRAPNWKSPGRSQRTPGFSNSTKMNHTTISARTAQSNQKCTPLSEAEINAQFCDAMGTQDYAVELALLFGRHVEVRHLSDHSVQLTMRCMEGGWDFEVAAEVALDGAISLHGGNHIWSKSSALEMVDCFARNAARAYARRSM
jgi:hypothetical protein